MTTFQAIIYSVIHGFSEFLPISSSAHHSLISFLLEWPAPTEAMAGALALGAFLSLLIYFRHDWASIISCFLQVILFRKKPMTLDERMPIFLLFSSLPYAVARYYLHDKIAELPWNPLWIAAGLALFGLPLGLSDSLSRRNKGMFDWTILDSLTVGLFQVAALVPGYGRLAACLTGGLFRNYNREAVVKFSLFAATPMVLASAIHNLKELDLRAAAPMADVSWLSFYISIVVTTLAGLLAIGGLIRHTQRSGFQQYVIYRWILALVIFGVYWLRNGSFR